VPHYQQQLENIIMTNEQIKVLNELTFAGYAVVVWTPEEIGDLNPRKVEDRVIELGNEVIYSLSTT
jgi:hypothetical protein